MEWTKFDTRLQSLIDNGSTRSAEYTPGTTHGAELKATALKMLTEAAGLLGPAVARAQKENHEAYLATQTVRTAETALEDAWETLHIEVQARLFARLLEDRAGGQALQQEAARTLGEWTPAAFRLLGVDRTLLVGDTILAFAARIVSADSTPLSTALQAHTALKAARDSANREAGEALAAMQALEAARDRARLLYISVRRVFGVVLALDNKEDALARYLAPLFPGAKAGGAAPDPGGTDAPASDAGTGTEPVA